MINHIFYKILISGLLLILFTDSMGQIRFQNPSFEVGTGVLVGVPVAWVYCNGTTDWEPGVYNNQPASHGTRYLGFWDGSTGGTTVEGTALGEGAMQLLIQDGEACPLVPGKKYTFSFDLMSDPSRSYTPGHMAIVAGFASCTPTKLFWKSNDPGVTHNLGTGWQRHTVEFVPDDAYTWFGFYAVSITRGGQHCSLDNLSSITRVAGEVSYEEITCAKNGSITFTAPAGGGPYDYTWYEGDTTTVRPGLNGATATNLGPGTYVLEVIDQTDPCPVPSLYRITLDAATPIIGVATTDTNKICNGEFAQLDFLSDQPDAPTYTYKWTPSIGLSNPNIKNPTASPPTTTTYTLTVDVPGDTTCTETYQITIEVGKNNPGIGKTLKICSNDEPVDLFTELSGNPDDNGNWVFQNGTPFQNPFNPEIHAPGKYHYIISTASCPADTATMIVEVSEVPDAGTEMELEVCNEVINLDLNNSLTTHPRPGRWELLQSNTATGSFSNSGLYNPYEGEDGEIIFIYLPDGPEQCAPDTAKLNLTVHPSPELTLNPIDSVCPGTEYTVEVLINGVANDYTAYFTGNGDPYQNASLANGLNSFNLPSSASLWLRADSIVSNSAPFCKAPLDQLEFSGHKKTAFSIVDSVVCDGDNVGIIAYFRFREGDRFSYQYSVDGGPFNQTGSAASLNLNSGTHYLVLKDELNCQPYDTVFFSKACNCVTDPGDMINPTDTIIVCGDGTATAQHGGNHVMDGNDAISYVLHTNPGTSPGNILQKNLNSANFAFQPPMVYDRVYYISAIVGDDDGTGHADAKAPNLCTQTAPGVPVFWTKIPEGTIRVYPPEICEADSIFIEYNLQGNNPFDVSYLENQLGYNHNSISGTEVLFRTGYQTGTIDFSNFQVADKYGCTAGIKTAPDPYQVLVNDSISASIDQYTCATDNETYSALLTIREGSGNYLVDGSAIPDSTFLKSNITSGVPVSFVASDDKNCNPITLSGSHTCPCATEAPNLKAVSGVQYFCADQAASAQLEGTQGNGDPMGYVGDGNDTWSFVLAIDPNQPIETMVGGSLSKSPVYAISDFPAGIIDTNQTYYICPLAMDEDSDNPGLVDISSKRCPLYTKPGIPIAWRALPSITISERESELCYGEQVVIDYSITTTQNADFEIISSRTDSTFFSNIAQGTMTIALAENTIGTQHTPISYYASSPHFVTNTGQTCVGKWVGDSARVNIHKEPRAEFIPNSTDPSGAYNVCLGENLSKAKIKFSGSDSVFAQITPNIGLIRSYDGNIDDLFISKNNLNLGNNVFSISQVSGQIVQSTGNRKLCAGSAGNPANLTVSVKDLPTLDIALDTNRICAGNPVNLRLIPSGSGSQFTAYDKNGQSYALNQDTSVFTYYPKADSAFVFTRIEHSIYSDESGNACGQDIYERALLQVNELPIATIFDKGAEICEGDSTLIYFKIEGNGPFSFQFENAMELGSEKTGYLPRPEDTLKICVRPNKDASYILINVTDANNCVSDKNNGSASVPVHQNPQPDFAADDRLSCTPLITQLRIISDLSNQQSNSWEIGGGLVFDNEDVLYINLQQPGSYDVRLTQTTTKGCSASIMKQSYLQVDPYPIAGFEIKGDPTVINPEVRILDKSQGAEKWDYLLDHSEHLSSLRQPIIQFNSQDTGRYYISQIVYSGVENCSGTLTHWVYVRDEVLVSIPNAFTPNGDGANEEFKPVYNGLEGRAVHFSIYNRWGEEIFRTQDPDRGWNGTYLGELVPIGAYTFMVRIKGHKGEEDRTYYGTVTVIE
ncbi:gliding motility-associated C-terminal domain-containing protein [Luteibaculum oceani]|uniref:Gliding motility-associated C-terminal domain-containing protein n=1 Tax=Luteibaculum oceani TaxID=1294296 RepID=A0A5C6V4X9_9FLAO|nr:gliding motility-associated C-terminal domain-containing protein [Luteibaculum oceani]TXC78615.1 gliding motility-associated C-terminal domain-containing protein [Luteibaculum oceani]